MYVLFKLLVLICWYFIDEHSRDRIHQETPSVHHEPQVMYMCVSVLCILYYSCSWILWECPVVLVTTPTTGM